jgi:hypothetical protein
LVALSQLEFEDEPPDEDDEDAAAREEGDGDDVESEEEATFEDAMENLTILEEPRLVAATA